MRLLGQNNHGPKGKTKHFGRLDHNDGGKDWYTKYCVDETKHAPLECVIAAVRCYNQDSYFCLYYKGYSQDRQDMRVAI